MKINGSAIVSLLCLASGTFARRGHRYRAYDDDTEPIQQKSRVTAFVNTDYGLKVECWEIGDLLPDSYITRSDGSKGAIRQTTLASVIGGITLFSFAPSITLFQFSATEVHSNGVDFRASPNLFTLKDGLIYIEAYPSSGSDISTQDGDPDSYVFADLNGDDWFYFEDTTTGSSSRKQCVNPLTAPTFTVRTISGSDTTLLNFQYEGTPSHKVLHEGRCNFAGLKPVDPSSSQSDPDSGRFRFRSQEL